MAEQLPSWIERARQGDLEAFSALVRGFQDMAVGYALSLLGDFHAAEDAAQEAFLSAFQSLGELRDPLAFPGWFRRVVFKHCDRITRKRRPIPVPDPEAVADESSSHAADEALERSELRHRVLSAVRSLPEHERSVATLFYLQDHSLREIADFVGIPVATVKTRLHSARGRLRNRLESVLRDVLADERPSRNERFERRVMQLAYAAYFGDVAHARALLDRHPQLVNAGFAWFWYWRWEGPGWQPLHRAAEQGRRELCELLLDRGANVNARHPQTGWTPLHMAFGHAAGPAQRELAEHLIARGARVDAFAAAALGDPERLADCDPNELGPEGATALHYAGSRDALDALLAEGLDPSARCRHNEATALRWLLAHGRDREVAERLLAEGCDWDVVDAVALGDLERVRERLDADPDALRRGLDARNLVTRAGASLLHLAANRGHHDVAAELLERGARVDETSGDGTTPLYAAAFNAHSRVVGLLLAHGAEVDRVDPEVGGTPLFWALSISLMPWQDRARLRETVRVLLAAGASPEAANHRGVTPLGLLASRGQTDLLDFVRQTAQVGV